MREGELRVVKERGEELKRGGRRTVRDRERD